MMTPERGFRAPGSCFGGAPSAEVVPAAAVHAQFLQQRDDGFDFFYSLLVREGVVRQNVPNAQQRPGGGIGHQSAVEVLLPLHRITPETV